METFYYPQTIKNITIALMDLFNDLYCVKYDASGTSAENIIVPLQYGNTDKTYKDRLENHYYDANDTEHGERFYQMFPRMSLLLDGITYNSNRCYGSNEFRYWLNETMEISGSNITDSFRDYQPTPYDLTFSLYIKTNSLDHFAQLMENILPYFNPKLMLRVKEFAFLNIERDLPVTLNSISPEFTDDLGNADRREINGTLSFTVAAFMYRPWTKSKIIKVINSRYFIGSSNTYDIHGNPVL